MGYRHTSNLYKDSRVMSFKRVYCLEKIHGCLREDALIHMADGSVKQIKEVQKGENVLSYDETNKIFVEKRVSDVIVQEVTQYLDWYEIELENGKTFACTEDHPILTTDGWICAKDITEKYDIVSIY